jgi:hypothetical protein
VQQPPQVPPPASVRIGLNGSAPAINGSAINGSGDLSQNLSDKLSLNSEEAARNAINNRFKSFDMKAMQKEAVLSYVKVRIRQISIIF